MDHPSGYHSHSIKSESIRYELGLDYISFAKCEDVKSVSEERLVARLGVTPLDAMFEIARSLRYLLEL